MEKIDEMIEFLQELKKEGGSIHSVEKLNQYQGSSNGPVPTKNFTIKLTGNRN